MDNTTGEDRVDRIAALERRVAALEAAVRNLRPARADAAEQHRADAAEQHGAREQPMSRAAPNAAPGVPQGMSATAGGAPAGTAQGGLRSLLPSVDLESLVGRYGTLVLATVSALAAVGTFLGWAIANGLLGPSQRIALGLIVAAALGAAGFRLRARERSFGASLLGLALAITHVCAWGAGPSLHLVPEWGAFLLAAAASIALAVFAHMEEDEPLWSVGFSGAAIAPFVTAGGKGSLPVLAAYGVAVLSLSGYAMGSRRWIVAGRLFLLAAAVYTAALASGSEREFGPLLAMGLPFSVALLGVIPWVGGPPRGERLRALGALSAIAALRTGLGTNSPLTHAATAAFIAAGGLLWLVIVDRTHTPHAAPPAGTRRLREGDWLDGGVLPLAFVAGFVMALDASARGTGIAMGIGAVVLFLAVTRFPRGSLRDAAVFAGVLCALIATLLLERGNPLLITATIAVLGAACFAANLAWPSASWTTLALIGFAWSVLAALVHLGGRAPYVYVPFATRPSAVCLVVLAAIAAAGRMARADARVAAVLRSGLVVWAFLWVHQELLFAFNRTAATLLRVTYYALASVLAVGAGRALALPVLRHAGLALAVIAAATALYGARNLDAIAARIGADLVAAVFLLAIAYWYRRPGAGTAEAGS